MCARENLKKRKFGSERIEERLNEERLKRRIEISEMFYLVRVIRWVLEGTY